MSALQVLFSMTIVVGIPLPTEDAKIFPNTGRAFHESLSTPGLVNPSGIAVTSGADVVYVAGKDSNTIYAFDSSGGLLFSFTGGGLSGPTGMDITSDDSALYVCSSATNDVKVFDGMGGYLFSIGGSGLTNPTDVALTSDDAYVYVASRGTNDIKVFQADAVGTFQFAISTPAMDLDPTGVALTSDDSHVYVSSSATNSIEVFTALGSHVTSITVDDPTDVALTSDDSVMYVPSATLVTVQVLDAATGELILSIGGPGILNSECQVVMGMMDGIFAITNFAPLDCNNNGIPDDREYPGCADAGIVLGDMNCDDLVNGLDIQAFVDYLVIDPYTCQADINQDGIVDIFDVPEFVSLLLAQ